MKKFIKLLLMILLGIAGICFAGAAIYGALHWHHAPGGRKLHKWSVSGTSSQESEANDFTSKASGFGEDVKKTCGFK